MCLITKHPAQVQTAKEDIVVYKLVEELKNSLNSSITSLYGPFQWIKYGIVENLPFSVREDDKFHIELNSCDLEEDCVTKGGFHTFKNLQDAIVCNKRWKSEFAIYKCIIPRGTQYIEGIFQQSFIGLFTYKVEKYPSYISKWLKFEKKICV